jgi:hypothetical protein
LCRAYVSGEEEEAWSACAEARAKEEERERGSTPRSGVVSEEERGEYRSLPPERLARVVLMLWLRN